METEKRLGFETAFEIDEAVWKKYPSREAKRIQKFLGFTRPTVQDIKNALHLSLFNQTLEFELIEKGQNPLKLHFLVNSCKTLVGMQKGGRSPEQITRICKGIGLAFFTSFLEALVPGASVNSLFVPNKKKEVSNSNVSYICGWEFLLPGI